MREQKVGQPSSYLLPAPLRSLFLVYSFPYPLFFCTTECEYSNVSFYVFVTTGDSRLLTFFHCLFGWRSAEAMEGT